jgi:FAD dependent oxidoreductase
VPTTDARRTYRSLSLWHDTLVASGDDDLSPRPELEGDLDVDVCIVGAGFTGLWTAYTLLVEDPSVRVAVLEPRSPGSGPADATAAGARRSSRRPRQRSPGGTVARRRSRCGAP